MSERDPQDSKDDRDNRSDQLNPNNDAYWQSRGDDERPDDWQERSGDDSLPGLYTISPVY